MERIQKQYRVFQVGRVDYCLRNETLRNFIVERSNTHTWNAQISDICKFADIDIELQRALVLQKQEQISITNIAHKSNKDLSHVTFYTGVAHL